MKKIFYYRIISRYFPKIKFTLQWLGWFQLDTSRFEFCSPTCKKELGTPAIGQTVAVPTPTFDGGKGDSRNLLGIIIEVFNLTIFFMIVIRLLRFKKFLFI